MIADDDARAHARRHRPGPTTAQRRITALSIAGVDPAAAVGALADMRTFAALGAYGTAVLTTLTAHGWHRAHGADAGHVTGGATGAGGSNGSYAGPAVHPVPPDFVERQLRTLVDAVELDAVRIGMLGTAEVADAVAGVLTDRPHDVVVLDPVFACAGDTGPVDTRLVAAVRRLMPVAALVTPNREEAALLLGTDVARDVGQMFDQARRLVDAGAPRVLLKGGHLGREDAVDVLVGPEGEDVLAAPWVDTSGSACGGCVLSAAIAVIRTHKPEWQDAVGEAKQWVSATIRSAQSWLAVPPVVEPTHAPHQRQAARTGA